MSIESTTARAAVVLACAALGGGPAIGVGGCGEDRGDEATGAGTGGVTIPPGGGGEPGPTTPPGPGNRQQEGKERHPKPTQP